MIKQPSVASGSADGNVPPLGWPNTKYGVDASSNCYVLRDTEMQVLYECIALLEELLRGANERLERPHTDSDVSSNTSTNSEEYRARLAEPRSPAMM
eukprot:5047666-Heterocapsa_arctica.AAC.1